MAERIFAVRHAQVRRGTQRLENVRRDIGVALLEPLIGALERFPVPFRKRPAATQKHSKLVIRVNAMVLDAAAPVNGLMTERAASPLFCLHHDRTYKRIDLAHQFFGLPAIFLLQAHHILVEFARVFVGTMIQSQSFRNDGNAELFDLGCEAIYFFPRSLNPNETPSSVPPPTSKCE